MYLVVPRLEQPPPPFGEGGVLLRPGMFRRHNVRFRDGNLNSHGDRAIGDAAAIPVIELSASLKVGFTE